MTIYQLIFALFALLFVGISFYQGRKSSSLGDFYVMEGKAGVWLVTGTYAATLVSALGMVGLTGTAYAQGPLVGILVWGTFLGFPITAFVLGPPLRRFGQVTVGDFLEARFESKTMRVLSTLVTLIGMGCFFVSQLVGSALITESILGIPFNYMVALAVFIFAVIAITGGSRSVTITDTIMAATILIFLGFIFSFAVMKGVTIEGYTALAQQRPAYFTATGGLVGWGTILGWQVLWAFGNASNPANITRCYLARDGRTVTCALMMTMALVCPVVWFTHVAASGVQIVNPDIQNASTVLIWAAMNVVTPVVGAFAIAGLFAAVLSTASTQILVLSFCISRDIYDRFMVKQDDPNRDAKVKLISRICIVGFAIYGMVAAWGRPTIIVQIGNFGTSVFACTFFPALLMGVAWKKCTREGAIAGVLAGLLVDGLLSLIPIFVYDKPLAWSGYLPWGIHPVLWGVAASFLTMYCVSLATKTTPAQDAVFAKCATIVESDHVMTLDTVKKYTWFSMGIGAALFAWVCWFASKVPITL